MFEFVTRFNSLTKQMESTTHCYGDSRVSSGCLGCVDDMNPSAMDCAVCERNNETPVGWHTKDYYFEPIHYAIIGKYTGEQIGCTIGEDGKADVLAEEPGSTFIPTPKESCECCND